MRLEEIVSKGHTGSHYSLKTGIYGSRLLMVKISKFQIGSDWIGSIQGHNPFVLLSGDCREGG